MPQPNATPTRTAKKSQDGLQGWQGFGAAVPQDSLKSREGRCEDQDVQDQGTGADVLRSIPGFLVRDFI